MNHKGEKIDWGQWAITGNDPDFNGTGNPDTGDDYGPAPGRQAKPRQTAHDIAGFGWTNLQSAVWAESWCPCFGDRLASILARCQMSLGAGHGISQSRGLHRGRAEVIRWVQIWTI